MKKIRSDYDLKDYYEIDRLGQVYKVTIVDGKRIENKMSPFLTKDGYLEYVLTTNSGTKKHVQEQRLVAMTYLPIPKTNRHIEVNHKDGNRTNNIVSNLEWVTKSENIRHSFDVLGKVVHNKGKTKQEDGSYS